MRMATLNELCELITDGTHYTPPDVGEGVPFLTVRDMTASGLDFKNCSRISNEEFRKAQEQNSAPLPGDVLFSKDGTVGKVRIVEEASEFAVLSSIAILRPDPKKLDSRFVAHYLGSPVSLAAATQRKTGSALTRIILRDLKQLPVPILPLDEQKRIAAILDQADALRGKRQRAIDRLNQLGQAIFHEMFFSTVGVPFRAIGDFAEVKGGKRLPKGSEYVDDPTSHAYIRVSDLNGVGIDIGRIKYISDEVHQAVRRYTVRRTDVIISIAGTIGVTATVPTMLDGANLTENAAKITPKRGVEFDPTYLAWALRSPEARSQILASTGQVTIGKLALFRIEKINLPMPETIQQRKFASLISAIERQHADHLRALKLTERLFQSIQNLAFRGEL
jgi:type I restriction enzyme, S subunit